MSIDKPYISPIIRGKEIKRVEFGAKVHKLQIDGIPFIEHLSFDAFHEGIRVSALEGSFGIDKEYFLLKKLEPELNQRKSCGFSLESILPMLSKLAEESLEPSKK